MIGPAIACGMPKTESLGNARLLTGKFEALDMHCQFLGALPYLDRCALHTFGEQISQSVAFSNAFNQAKNGIRVSPLERESRIVEETPLMAFHGEGDSYAGGDCVQSVFIAEMIGADDDLGISVPTHWAEGICGLILRPFDASRVLSLLDL